MAELEHGRLAAAEDATFGTGYRLSSLLSELAQAGVTDPFDARDRAALARIGYFPAVGARPSPTPRDGGFTPTALCSLDTAWAACEAALPEGWWVQLDRTIGEGCRAKAGQPIWSPDYLSFTAHGPTPAAALTALTLALRDKAAGR